MDFYDPQLEKKLSLFDKGKTYFLHCAMGGRSGYLAEWMRSMGFSNIYNLMGSLEMLEELGCSFIQRRRLGDEKD